MKSKIVILILFGILSINDHTSINAIRVKEAYASDDMDDLMEEALTKGLGGGGHKK